VDTAAQFMAEMYGRLAQGDALGEAASFSRKQLHAQPLRGSAPRLDGASGLRGRAGSAISAE